MHTLRRHPLAALCATLDQAFADAARAGHGDDPTCHATFGARLREALGAASRDGSWLDADARVGASDRYVRHVLAADPAGRYAIASLVWAPGQASPVHAHRTWCGYTVIEGTLAEALYTWDAATQCATPLREQPRAAGATAFVGAGRAAIHQLGNRSEARAVSLHVYGVPAEQMATHVNDLVELAAPLAV